MLIRAILPADDAAIAKIIRDVLSEFGANKPGTAYYDSTTDSLSELFTRTGSIYYVAIHNNQLIGGAGIFPSDGLAPDTCELVKMYLSPQARGRGLGRLLIEKALSFATQYGYRYVYLETMPELNRAMKIYEKFGFEYLDGPLGNTGHFGCNRWMLKKLPAARDSNN